ncbi:MAG: hypothetical protein K2X66_04735 [Cyanobacteria bacterium]|nr:hypothetical protein [Cyanobacteriota bacterium]
MNIPVNNTTFHPLQQHKQGNASVDIFFGASNSENDGDFFGRSVANSTGIATSSSSVQGSLDLAGKAFSIEALSTKSPSGLTGLDVCKSIQGIASIFKRWQLLLKLVGGRTVTAKNVLSSLRKKFPTLQEKELTDHLDKLKNSTFLFNGDELELTPWGNHFLNSGKTPAEYFTCTPQDIRDGLDAEIRSIDAEKQSRKKDIEALELLIQEKSKTLTSQDSQRKELQTEIFTLDGRRKNPHLNPVKDEEIAAEMTEKMLALELIELQGKYASEQLEALQVQLQLTQSAYMKWSEQVNQQMVQLIQERHKLDTQLNESKFEPETEASPRHSHSTLLREVAVFQGGTLESPDGKAEREADRLLMGSGAVDNLDERILALQRSRKPGKK